MVENQTSRTTSKWKTCMPDWLKSLCLAWKLLEDKDNQTNLLIMVKKKNQNQVFRHNLFFHFCPTRNTQGIVYCKKMHVWFSVYSDCILTSSTYLLSMYYYCYQSSIFEKVGCQSVWLWTGSRTTTTCCDPIRGLTKHAISVLTLKITQWKLCFCLISVFFTPLL